MNAKRVLAVAILWFFSFCFPICSGISEGTETSFIHQWIMRFDLNSNSISPRFTGSISRPMHSERYGNLEISVTELCADTLQLYSAVSFRLVDSSANDSLTYSRDGFFYVHLPDMQYKFYLSVAVLGESNDTFDIQQLSPNEWIETIHINFSLYNTGYVKVCSNQMIDVEYTLMACYEENDSFEQAQPAFTFSVPYQILPTIDECSFCGDMQDQDGNVVFSGFSITITPLRIDYFFSYPPAQSDDSLRDVTSYRLYDTEGISMYLYHDALPDIIVAAPHQEGNVVIYIFQRQENKYVFRKTQNATVVFQ